MCKGKCACAVKCPDCKNVDIYNTIGTNMNWLKQAMVGKNVKL